jgi:NAD(P)-dependent dehydrogenase (short-subunit alcohol dehydrogenase family)
MEGPKTVLVTGAASGIGAAVAERFLSAGYQVALFDIDGDAARATCFTEQLCSEETGIGR